MQKNFSSKLLNLFTICFSILFLLLFCNTMFFANLYHKRSIPAQILTFAAILLLLISAYFLINFVSTRRQMVKDFFKNRSGILLIFGLVLLAAFQIWVLLSSYCTINWDVGSLYITASSADMHSHTEYYSRYPNNLFLLFIFRAVVIVHSMLGFSFEIWLTLGIINIICIDIAVLFAVLLARKIFGLKASYFTFGLSAILFGVFPWVMVPYSDTLSMPLITGMFYLYYAICTSSKKKYKYVFSALFGLILLFCFLTKPTAVIVPIAIVIVHLLSNFTKKGFKKMLRQVKYAAIILLVFAILSAAYNGFLSAQKMIIIEPGVSATPSHYMMMGMQTIEEGGLPRYGGWNQADMLYAFSFETSEEMDAACREHIRLRLKNFGLFGYLEFLWNKICWIISDGTFFWDGEGDFAFYRYDESNNIFKRAFYPSGDLFFAYRHFSQGIWLITMLGVAFSGFLKEKSAKKKYFSNIIRLAIFGLLLFLLLFEGRSRYLLNNLPMFAVLAGYGFAKLSNTSFFSRKHKTINPT